MRHKPNGDDYVLICKICGEVNNKAFEMDQQGRIKRFRTIKETSSDDKKEQ